MSAEVSRKPGPGEKILRDTLRLFDRSQLRIGILDGTKVHEPDPEKPAPPEARTEITIGEIAARNEFGIGVPERSFLRGYFFENKATVAEAATRLVKARGAKRATLDLLGLWVVGQIQARISNRIAPENSIVTIQRKGSTVPLIDTGQLRSSITHKVETKAS